MPEWISATAAVVATATAIVGVIVAYWQLSNLNRTLRMNALTVVLQLEAEMNARKERVDEVAAKIRKQGIKDEPNEGLVEILDEEMQGYLENWLNAADRLAYCILRGYLAERDWKAEYREYFLGLVRDHEEKFGPKSIYTNIIDLSNKWRRE